MLALLLTLAVNRLWSFNRSEPEKRALFRDNTHRGSDARLISDIICSHLCVNERFVWICWCVRWLKMAAAPEQSERITETSCDKPAENTQESAQNALITHRINVQLSLQITYISIFPPDRETWQDGWRFYGQFLSVFLSSLVVSFPAWE